MTVYELTRDLLDELKESYFYQILNNDDEAPFAVQENSLHYTAEQLPDYPREIPDDVIFNVYSGIHFVNDDFFCSTKWKDNDLLECIHF